MTVKDQNKLRMLFAFLVKIDDKKRIMQFIRTFKMNDNILKCKVEVDLQGNKTIYLN